MATVTVAHSASGLSGLCSGSVRSRRGRAAVRSGGRWAAPAGAGRSAREDRLGAGELCGGAEEAEDETRGTRDARREHPRVAGVREDAVLDARAA